MRQDIEERDTMEMEKEVGYKHDGRQNETRKIAYGHGKTEKKTVYVCGA